MVTGGTGKVGRTLIPRLLAAGHEVRGLSRKPRGDAAHEWVTGDLRSGAGLDAATGGAGTIVHLATANGSADLDCMRNLLAATKHTGNPRVIFLSIVGVDEIPFFYYRAKLEAEQLLADSGLRWTVLRATQFHDLVAAICAVQRWLPAIMLPAGMRFQPIDLTDVADRLAELVAEPADGRVPDIGGPEIRPATDLARAWLTATGRHRAVLSLPLGGKTFRAYRAGANLVPEHAVGRVSFADFLTAQGVR